MATFSRKIKKIASICDMLELLHFAQLATQLSHFSSENFKFWFKPPPP